MEIYVPNEIDWDWIGQVGLEEDLSPYLVKDFVRDGSQLHVMGGIGFSKCMSRCIKNFAGNSSPPLLSEG